MRFLSSTHTRLATFAIALAMATSSTAQSSRLRPFAVDGASKSGVSISVSYQFFLVGETTAVSDQASLADQGRRHLYKLLAKECDMLLETIATHCTMQRANVNTQLRHGRRNQPDGVRVSGSAIYKIQLKPNQAKQ